MKKKIALMFDVDGVIAETPHEEAWKAAAIEWKIIPANYNFTEFYAKHVAGEPGDIGAYNILSMLKPNGKSHFEKQSMKNQNEKIRIAEKFRNPVKQKYVDENINASNFKGFSDVIEIIKKAKELEMPIMAVSSSENAKNILEKLDILKLFKVTALGAETYWRIKIEKINHYAMAYGKLLQALKCDAIENVIVFEDAPKGVEAVAKLGFQAIGISRTSTTGACLATKQQLLNSGASQSYNEQELQRINLGQIIKDLRIIKN